MSNKPPPDHTRRLVKQKTKLQSTATKRQENRHRIQQLIKHRGINRSISNFYTYKNLAGYYGRQFSKTFYQEIRALYREKDSEGLTANNMIDITRMMSNMLRNRQNTIAIHIAEEASTGHERGDSSKGELPPAFTFQLCHLYLALYHLYNTEDENMKIKQRQIFHHTELNLDEIRYVVDLWARGVGQHVIAQLCSIELSRVRALYRSLEEVAAAEPESKIQISQFNISNQLWLWIVANCKVVQLDGHNEVYIVPRKIIESKVIDLEIEDRTARLQAEKEIVSPIEANKLDDITVENFLDHQTEPLVKSELPQIVDPLAEDVAKAIRHRPILDPKSYVVTRVVDKVPSVQVVHPQIKDVVKQAEEAESQPIKEIEKPNNNSLLTPVNIAELEQIKQLETNDYMAGRQPETHQQYLLQIRKQISNEQS